MAAPKKSQKQATKGSKQIIDENKTTITHYSYMILGSNIIYLSVMLLLYIDSFTTGIIILTLLTAITHAVCYNLLRYAAKITLSEDGKMLDCGTDLNMKDGIAEHIKDMIILASGTQVLALLSDYFWLLLLLCPCRAFFILWRSVLAPWFFQPGPEKPEVDESVKKAKKNRYN